MKYDVCVFGGCSLDMMYYGDENNNFNSVPDKLVPGGKASNQAVAAARAGAKTVIITRIGKDSVGDKIFDNLQSNGIFTNNIEIIDGLKNDCARIYIDGKTKDNNIIRETGAIDSFNKEMIQSYAPVFLNSKIVVAQLKVPKEVTEELIDFCYKNNKPLIITPCRPDKLKINEGRNKELIDKITYITCNRHECETIFGTDDVEACVQMYPNKLIVTLGEDGVIYYDGKEIQHFPAIKIDKLVDTTGAGDTFNGNLASALAQGYTFHDAVERAQYASAMKIQVETAQDGMPYKDDLDQFIKKVNLRSNTYSLEFDIAYSAIMDAWETIKNKKITEIRVKDDKSFVTESDLLVEKILIERIKDSFPSDNFVTEESNSQNKINGRTWVIDPIDGTTHYMKDSIFWGIQLAFIDNNDMQFSIIYLPKLQELYYSVKDVGSFLNHKRIILNEQDDVSKCIIEFCGSIGKEYEAKKKLLEMMLNSQEKVAGFMHINSCCIGFTNVLAGRTDALILSTKKPWDIIPGIMLLKEAGISGITIGNLSLYTNNSALAKLIVNEQEIEKKM